MPRPLESQLELVQIANASTTHGTAKIRHVNTRIFHLFKCQIKLASTRSTRERQKAEQRISLSRITNIWWVMSVIIRFCISLVVETGYEKGHDENDDNR